MRPSPSLHLKAAALVASSIILLVLGNLRWGAGALAWVAPVPLLAALRLKTGWRFRVLVAGALAAGWTLATFKIVTVPVPAAIAFAYGIPLALAHLPAYLLWDALVRRGHDGRAIVAFGAASALLEWAQAELTPLAVWGAAPASQAGQLAVLQVLALAGMPGLSFLMHTAAATVEAAWAGRIRPAALVAVSGVVAVSLAWGAWRVEQPIEGPTVQAAAIRTDSTFSGLPIDAADVRRQWDDALFARTAAAASAGAQLVVWTEAATLVVPAEERALIERAAAAARAHRIELVIAYIMPIAESPLRYENRLRWFAPDGTERLSYLKHHPVPGEPAVAGESVAGLLQTSVGPATGAICYDYDFPAMARAHARAGVGLVALPSSDWRGIDPLHSEMAAMRAVEGGFSILRPVRWGLTAGIDAHGRLRGQLSTNEPGAPFLLVTLPAVPHPTLYAALGNTVLAPLVAALLWALAALLRHRSWRVVTEFA